MSRRRKVTLRPSYRSAVEWIALEDNAGEGDSVDLISGYISTHLVAHLFGIEETRDVARHVAEVRRCAGLDVGPGE